MVTIREWLKEKREGSKRKAAELFKNTKDKTSETYNKVLDTEIDDIKNKTKETVSEGAKLAEEAKEGIKSEFPAFVTFFIWLALPYIIFFFYRLSFDGWANNMQSIFAFPVNIFVIPVLIVGLLLTINTAASKYQDTLKSWARTMAVFISLISFPAVSEYFDFKEYEKQRYFCNNETFIINQMELFPIIDEKNCKKLQEGKLNYFEFLRVWKNIIDV